MFPLDKLAELSTTPFFAALSAAALHDLLPELTLVHLPGGEFLFRAGESGDSMYVVLSGRLRVLLEHAGGAKEVVRELSRGDAVGELALLTSQPRSATVRAIRDAELVKLSRSSFESAIRSDPKLIGQIAVQMADRQRQGNDAGLSRRNVRTIAVLPFDEAAQRHEFAKVLANAIACAGSTLHLTSRSIPSNCDNEALNPDRDRIAANPASASLNDLEAVHRFVIYEADAGFSPWTERCLRQADLILVVAQGDQEPASAKLKKLGDYFDSREHVACQELVLLYPSKSNSPTWTGKWLTSIRVTAHHHVTLTEPEDVKRLARLLTATAVSLVLSGGGARGFAHIGVIRALHESSVPIDAIGGTSMGAVIAAQHALGWDWQTMARINREQWPRCEPQKNYTLPLVALNSGKRMDDMLKKMLGDIAIENLRTKFFCVSTSLTRATARIHQAGVLWKAVRASVSMPGIGPPAIENGEILIDGGLIDNLPVGVMKNICQGAVFAVDVSEQLEFKSALTESYAVSGWKLLWRRLNPFAERMDIPNLFNILYRTTTVGGIRAIETAKIAADLCFEPPVANFGIFDWRAIDLIVDAGYHHALRKLEQSGGVIESLIKTQTPVL